MRPVPAHQRRLFAAVAAAIVVVLIAGVGAAVSLTGGSPRAATLVAGSPSPEATTDSPTPSDPDGSPSPAPSVTQGLVPPSVPSIGASDLPSASVAAIGAPLTPSIAPVRSRSASASPSPPGVPTCTKSDFTLSVVTDASSYPPQGDISISASVTATRTCDTTVYDDIDGGVHDPAGNVVETINCAVHDGEPIKCPTERNGQPVHWKAGQTAARDDTWDQVVRVNPTTYADPGAYTVDVALGDLTATARFAITAPECTPAQLALTFTVAQDHYAQGSTARFTATKRNSSATACMTGPADSRDETPATDGPGQVFWNGCGDRGMAYDAGCAVPAYGLVPILLKPAQTTSFTKTWDLMADGTKDHPDPSPVPPGPYTLTWTPAGGEGSASATFVVDNP